MGLSKRECERQSQRRRRQKEVYVKHNRQPGKPAKLREADPAEQEDLTDEQVT